MNENNVIATMGMKAAHKVTVKGTLVVNIKLTRRYIWLMKLKYIWAVIRADFASDAASTEKP